MTILSEHREQPVVQGNEPRKSDDMFPSIRGAWEAILFYGGIPTFTVYPLGLATLYLYQKSIRDYNHTDAWYAVSLIPKTTVFGVGAEVLLGSLTYTLISAFLAATLFFSLCPLYRYVRYRYGAQDAATRARLAGPLWKRVADLERRELKWMALLLLIGIPFLLLIPTSRFVLGNVSFVWLPSLFSGFGGAWLLARDYRRKLDVEVPGAELENPVSKVHNRRWMLRGLTLVYVGALLSAVIAAAYPTSNPDSTYQAVDLKLPKAALDTGGNYACTVEEPCPLLSHSDGYWNIITPPEQDILSIPDDEVSDSKVRVLLGSDDSSSSGE
jgi:hypothetical protein